MNYNKVKSTVSVPHDTMSPGKEKLLDTCPELLVLSIETSDIWKVKTVQALYDES